MAPKKSSDHDGSSPRKKFIGGLPKDTSVGSLKGKDSAASKKTTRILIDSLDSDSEGFVEEDSPAPSKVNGKTPSEAKSGKKKVTFEGPKSGGKASDTPTDKGDWGKGGKDFSSGKGQTKGGLPQATPVKVPIKEVELKLEIDLPKNARVLMDCEAAIILLGIQEHLTVLLEDPGIKIPESFDKALQYSTINSHYTNVQSVRQALNNLKKSGVTDGEISMIGNICPESLDEIYALVPSLKANRGKNEGPIRDVLASLPEFKSSN